MPAVLRTVTATRYVTPLREGGSLPAHRRGRRRRPLRPQVPRRRAGPKALIGRAGRRRDRPRARPARARDRVRRARPGARPPEPDPEIQELIAASGGRNLGPRLPARRAAVHPGAGRRRPAARRRRRLVRRARDQRRPHAAQPEPAALAPALWLIDHGAALYVQHAAGDPALARPRTLPGDPRPRAAAVRRADPEADARLAAAGRRSIEAIPAELAGDWADAAPTPST